MIVLCNIVTLSNLFCGVMAITSAISGQYVFAAWAIIIAASLDIFDGKIARKFKISSSLGKNLDSLSDVISFGVAPLVLMYMLNYQSARNLALAFMLIYLFCGVWRLARFNASAAEKPNDFFKGLPITAAGSMIALTILVFQKNNSNLITSVVLFFPLILAFLMVSNIKYPSFKQDKILTVRYLPGFILILLLCFIIPIITIWLFFLAYTFLSPLIKHYLVKERSKNSVHVY